jgi:hypothetical protein
MQQNIETFYQSVAQSPATLTQLTSGVQSPDEFIERAVAMGNEQGYTFTREEATSWINGQIESRKNGELSDVQLEGVAGGKGAPLSNAINTHIPQIPQGLNAAASGMRTGLDQAGSAIGSAATTVGNWFSSW